MADRIRAFDWSATSLGALDRWPERLIGAVEMVLATRQCALLAIGPERILLFNDEASRQDGPIHPDMLGQPLPRALPHGFGELEAWSDRVFAGEGVHIPARADGSAAGGASAPSDVYLTPIRSVEGTVLAACVMFVAPAARTIADEGAAQAGMVRPRGTAVEVMPSESEERYRLLFDLIDQGFCVVQMIFDEAGDPADYMFLETNAAFNSLTGLSDPVGRRMRDLAPGHERHWFDIFGRIARTGRTERFEQRAAALGFWYDVYAFPVGTPAEHRVAILFSDIGTRKQQETALWEIGQRFQALATAGNYTTYRMSPDWRVMYQLDSDTLAVTADPIMDWIEKYIPADDLPGVLASIDRAIRSKSLFDLEHRVRRADGTIGWVRSRAVPLLDTDGEITEWFGTGADIDERRRRERGMALLGRITDDLSRLSTEEAILQAVSAEIAEHLELDLLLFVDVEGDPDLAVVRHCWTSEARRGIVGTHPWSAFLTPELERAVRANEVAVVEDAATDPRMEGEAPAALQLPAFLAVPFCQDGTWRFLVEAARATPREWREDEVELMREVVSRICLRVQRARAEAARCESEDRLRRFGEASRDILWARDARTLQWVYLTPAFEAVYGVSREEARAGDNYRNWQDRIVPEDRALAAASIAKLQAGEHATFEYRIRRATDGAVRWLRDTAFPIVDAAGKVILIGGIGHDFTDHRDTELRFRSLVEGIPQLVWRAVDDGEWTWASPQWTAYTGQGRAEYQGRGWLQALHPDDRAAAREAWSHAREQGGFEVKGRLRRACDGTHRWFQTRATAVRDRSGTIVEWLGTSTDFHELRRLQELQETLLAELQHRVRNILAVTRSIISRSDDGRRSTEDYVQHLQGRISALARTQVMLTRSPGAGVDLEELIRDELLAQVASEDQFELSGINVDLSPKAAEVLALAVHELATNANKYGAFTRKDGRLSIRWAVEQRDDRRWLVLDWRESGVPVVDAAPRHRGFGAELVSRRIPYELQGSGQFELKPGGLHGRIEFPLGAGDSILQVDGVDR